MVVRILVGQLCGDGRIRRQTSRYTWAHRTTAVDDVAPVVEAAQCVLDAVKVDVRSHRSRCDAVAVPVERPVGRPRALGLSGARTEPPGLVQVRRRAVEPDRLVEGVLV